MIVETEIYNTLAGLVPGHVWPDLAPLDVARPFITFQQVGGESVGFVEQVLPSKENARMQINVWADTRIQAKTLIKQIEAAMVAATAFQASAEGAPISRYEPDTKLYGSQQDFSVWSDR